MRRIQSTVAIVGTLVIANMPDSCNSMPIQSFRDANSPQQSVTAEPSALLYLRQCDRLLSYFGPFGPRIIKGTIIKGTALSRTWGKEMVIITIASYLLFARAKDLLPRCLTSNFILARAGKDICSSKDCGVLPLGIPNSKPIESGAVKIIMASPE
ncbi:hypothetical protein K505DRAFT_104941 [Melanomma pulvis-pyrius CBS 109.77]|uniref:Uncharacterized protein n=1 Tax=Melanomma pulvis-pyrius CBS 109.77 TaxID=1314802 RepID=A0A6A6XSB6_9PLEO|nr:hypothetical protein K505DRAFT_104941 [Melanomma pulvis-pyrius CBS 109.77]